VLVVAGEIATGFAWPMPAVSLVERFGRRRAWTEPEGCIAEVVAAHVHER
jgi:hypothetical protein